MISRSVDNLTLGAESSSRCLLSEWLRVSAPRVVVCPEVFIVLRTLWIQQWMFFRPEARTLRMVLLAPFLSLPVLMRTGFSNFSKLSDCGIMMNASCCLSRLCCEFHGKQLHANQGCTGKAMFSVPAKIASSVINYGTSEHSLNTLAMDKKGAQVLDCLTAAETLVFWPCSLSIIGI
jgi:hypothetical protein